MKTKRGEMVMKKRNKIGWWVSLGVIIVLVIFFVILLIQGGENYTSGGEQTIKISVLDCVNSSTEEAFFKSDNVQRYRHEIRATFKNDKIDDISYIYEGTYNSASAAESASAALHADYNMYMGEKGANPESLNPNFSEIKSKLKITLYGDDDKVNAVTGRLFFLNEDEVKNIDEYTGKKLEKLYKGKGFSCVYKE